MVVVGGGFAGLSTALHLKDRVPGLAVAILESEHIGFGASGRGLGMVSPIHPGLMFGHIAHQHGEVEARWFAGYLLDEARRWQNRIAAAAIACEYRSCPALVVARDRRELRLGRQVQENLTKAGIRQRRLGGGELLAWCGFPAAGGFVLDDGVGVMHPYALARGLADHFARRGGEIHENTTVKTIRPAGASVEVVTGTGARIEAGHVVVATNGYTSKLGLGRHNSGRTIHTYLLATEPLAQSTIERLGRGLREGVAVDVRVRFNYARLWGDRLLFGGSTQMFSRADSRADLNVPAQDRLQREMVRRFPFLESTLVTAAWGGPIHLRSLAQMPLVGEAAGLPHVMLNTGYNQGGILFALSSGRLVSGLVLGGSSTDGEAARVRRLYDSSRLSPTDLARLVPWLCRP